MKIAENIKEVCKATFWKKLQRQEKYIHSLCFPQQKLHFVSKKEKEWLTDVGHKLW